jgi:hypothetical protein
MELILEPFVPSVEMIKIRVNFKNAFQKERSCIVKLKRLVELKSGKNVEVPSNQKSHSLVSNFHKSFWKFFKKLEILVNVIF